MNMLNYRCSQRIIILKFKNTIFKRIYFMNSTTKLQPDNKFVFESASEE